jgi:hypothetical protein
MTRAGAGWRCLRPEGDRRLRRPADEPFGGDNSVAGSDAVLAATRATVDAFATDPVHTQGRTRAPDRGRVGRRVDPSSRPAVCRRRTHQRSDSQVRAFAAKRSSVQAVPQVSARLFGPGGAGGECDRPDATAKSRISPQAGPRGRARYPASCIGSAPVGGQWLGSVAARQGAALLASVTAAQHRMHQRGQECRTGDGAEASQ